MTKKIFRSTVAVGLAVLAASLVIIMSALYSYFGKLQEQQLKDELSIAAAAMAEGDGMSYLTRLDSDNYRITWLRADGVVLYDTRADAATMENHAQRQEVRQALANGAGESSRYSNTMLTKMLYYAQRLPDGTVLRLSASRVTAGAVLLGMLQPILLVIAAALILSGLLASRVSKRIVEPLNRLDLEHPLENEAYEELSPLLRRLEHQRRQIDQQIKVNQIMTDYFVEKKSEIMGNKPLAKYMLSYLDIITTISSILLIRINTPESLEKKRELLNYIRQKDKKVYRKLRYGLLGNCMNLPGKTGRWISVEGYKICQKFFGFN